LRLADLRFLSRPELQRNGATNSRPHINGHAAANGWRLPEHFTNEWSITRTYAGNPMLPTDRGNRWNGPHLLLQFWELGGRKLDWLPQYSKALFGRAVLDGWDKLSCGFYYTLDRDGSLLIRDRYWWPCRRRCGRTAHLNAIDAGVIYEEWYRRIWNFIAVRFIDRENSGWRAQIDDSLHPSSGSFR
jgi:sulfoquinovose isomerase